MSIRVGVHENLVIAKTVKNDKGSLVIGVKKVDKRNPLERLSSPGSGPAEQDFLIYPPKQTDYNGKKLNSEELVVELEKIIAPLSHILSQYMTSDKVEASWNQLAGTGITTENYSTEIVKPAQLDKVYANIVDQFIAAMKPYVGDNGKQLRGVFPRQSVAKHFPALRRKYLESQPIFESMEVPAASSRIKFSDYEIAKKLNNPEAITAATPVSKDEAKIAEELFHS